MIEHLKNTFFISVLFLTGFIAESYAQQSAIDNFNNINSDPLTIRFTNDQEINNRGGHLQGVQYLKSKGEEYAFLSGSSDTYAYYSVVKLGSINKVVSVNNLMEKPFKHAGGLQIFQNYMAVGIEDNSKKDISKVCIYDITNPEKSGTEPILVIERKGEPLRSTAGCVGFTKYKNKALLAVGDWDTKHIDLYTCKFDQLEKMNFEKIGSIDTKEISKKDWIDKNWHSYQNINLFSFNNNELYLIGLGQNEQDENVADLFSLKENGSNNFTLIKVASKIFSCTNECNFKAGAGVILSDEGNFEVISSTYNIKATSYLNYFRNSPNQ